jgi:hypothetical protein
MKHSLTVAYSSRAKLLMILKTVVYFLCAAVFYVIDIHVFIYIIYCISNK